MLRKVNYNTNTNYILIICELSNVDHVPGIVSQTRASCMNQTHAPKKKLKHSFRILKWTKKEYEKLIL